MPESTVSPARRRALNELLEVVGAPRVISAGAQLWISAAVLGGLRQASNEAHRAHRRDRGTHKNAAGDLQGAFGESLVATLLEDELPEAVVRFDPLRWEGAGDDVDARVDLHGEQFLIETKCHLHEPGKRLFLVNADAAERSQARGARSFVPVISSVGAAVAVLGAPIRVPAVLGWAQKTWSYGDPARSAELQDISRRYFELPYGELVSVVEAAGLAIEPSWLTSIGDQARERFPVLRDKGIEISRSPREAMGQLSMIFAP